MKIKGLYWYSQTDTYVWSLTIVLFQNCNGTFDGSNMNSYQETDHNVHTSIVLTLSSLTLWSASGNSELPELSEHSFYHMLSKNLTIIWPIVWPMPYLFMLKFITILTSSSNGLSCNDRQWWRLYLLTKKTTLILSLFKIILNR